MMKKNIEAPVIRGFVDTHFHTIHSIQKGLTRKDILDSAFDSGMSRGIDIATGPENFKERLTLAKDYPELYLSVGYYPSWAESIPDDLEETLISQAKKSDKVVAVGEIGMDYHWNYSTPENQKELFIRQIIVANQLKLPIIVHCRNAQKDLVKILTETQAEYRGVIHCFSGNYDFASACLDLGFYISFAGNLTYKNAPELREVLGKIPMDTILLETDSPYLSPEPQRGRTNTPANVRFTYQFAADILGIKTEDLADIIQTNMDNLFNLQRS